MNNLPYDLPKDNRLTRMRKGYKDCKELLQQ